ncbi:WD repeat-containing protein 74 [Phymastichus coffea]|uniref:WD repeat-containing protein 74 n=1 Tax=Phymastichus coffea TaxID=108790 RepID=UPI00273C8D4B|nr:WD repeat-containing protein 74 [Phymastichus coffea]
MSYKDNFNVFVGGKSGIFKGVNVKEQSCVMKNIQNLVSITNHHEVTCMSWGDDHEMEILLGCGSKGVRSIKIYDSESHTFKTSFICDLGEGNINGIARYDSHILTAVDSGHVKLWKNSEREENVLNVGGNLLRMRQSNQQKNIIAVGGNENPLKLFDLKKNVNTFTAKNMSNDWLQLRVPVNVTDICFLTDNTKIVTIGKYGHIRLYDTKAQRRPVINLEMTGEALKSLSNCVNDRQVVCGTGRGRINLIDLRKVGKILNTYKGPVGAVTSIGVSRIEPYVVSVGLDRHLYVHDINSKALLKKVYLTSKLSCMVLRSDFSIKEAEKEENAANNSDDNLIGSEIEYTDNESEEEI